MDLVLIYVPNLIQLLILPVPISLHFSFVIFPLMRIHADLADPDPQACQKQGLNAQW